MSEQQSSGSIPKGGVTKSSRALSKSNQKGNAREASSIKLAPARYVSLDEAADIRANSALLELLAPLVKELMTNRERP